MSIPLFLLVASAFGFGGSYAGPVGASAPTGSGLQIVVAPSDEGTTLVAGFHVASNADDVAVIWPIADTIPNTAVPLDPRWFGRLETTTRARVEALTCDELVDTIHWKTVPGCASYDYTPPPLDRGEDAVATVGIDARWSPVVPTVEIIAAADLADWLELRNLALEPAFVEALAAAPPLPLLTIWSNAPVEGDTWLGPVSVRTSRVGALTLPLTLSSVAARTRQEIVIYGVAATDVPNPSLPNYPQGTVQNDCVLSVGASAREALDASRRSAASEVALPPWFLDHAANAARCSPCTDEPLDAFTLSTFGFVGEPSEARLSRIFMAYDPQDLDEDPILTFAPFPGFDGNPVDLDTRFLAHEPGLQAAFQVCGEDALRPDGAVCDNIRLPTGGCNAGGWPTGWRTPLVGTLVLFWLRRRSLSLGLTLCVVVGTLSPPTEARPIELGPKIEVLASASVLGTDRVVPEGLDRGAPWLLNPYLGVEVRKSLLGWRDGHNVGVVGGFRGLTGRAAPFSDVGTVGFTLVEPFVGVDVRHGQFRKLSPCWFGRTGGAFVLSTLWPSTSAVRAVPSIALHGGVGTWLGQGVTRTAVELRALVVPRTDGFETRYHPNLGIPGFLFFPGTANLLVVVGAARY